MFFEPRRIRVRYSLDHWTPFLRDVFDKIIPRLTHSHSQILFFVLYDRVWRSREGQVAATPTDLSRWIGADVRTVDQSLCELIQHRFIDVLSLGRRHSRTNKPRWTVPLTRFDFRSEGPWTPVPRFFIYQYPQVYPKSILLIILLWHQHRWNKLGLDLPWPLEIWTKRDQKGNDHRHFHVRAVFYERKKGRGRSAVTVTQEFARHFHVRTGRDFVDCDDESDD